MHNIGFIILPAELRMVDCKTTPLTAEFSLPATVRSILEFVESQLRRKMADG